MDTRKRTLQQCAEEEEEEAATDDNEIGDSRAGKEACQKLDDGKEAETEQPLSPAPVAPLTSSHVHATLAAIVPDRTFFDNWWSHKHACPAAVTEDALMRITDANPEKTRDELLDLSSVRVDPQQARRQLWVALGIFVAGPLTQERMASALADALVAVMPSYGTEQEMAARDEAQTRAADAIANAFYKTVANHPSSVPPCVSFHDFTKIAKRVVRETMIQALAREYTARRALVPGIVNQARQWAIGFANNVFVEFDENISDNFNEEDCTEVVTHSLHGEPEFRLNLRLEFPECLDVCGLESAIYFLMVEAARLEKSTSAAIRVITTPERNALWQRLLGQACVVSGYQECEIIHGLYTAICTPDKFHCMKLFESHDFHTADSVEQCLEDIEVMSYLGAPVTSQLVCTNAACPGTCFASSVLRALKDIVDIHTVRKPGTAIGPCLARRTLVHLREKVQSTLPSFKLYKSEDED